MAHNLIVNYGLYKHMEVFVSPGQVPPSPSPGDALQPRTARGSSSSHARPPNSRAPQSHAVIPRRRAPLFCALPWEGRQPCVVAAAAAQATEPQKPVLVDAMEMTRFHTDDYVDFLRTVTPDNMHDHLRSLKR